MKDFQTRLTKGLLIAASIILWSCDDDGIDTTPATVSLNLNSLLNGQPLEMNTQSYDNPNGTGNYIVEDFKFYVTNIKLINSTNGNEFVEPESYHLARFTAGANTYTINIHEVSADNYDQLQFAIGVDPLANTSIDNFGDLDPNNQMAWNWDIGYKFVLVEGRFFDSSATEIPLIFHIGFDENYLIITWDLPQSLDLFQSKSEELNFNVELSEVFNNPNPIDFNMVNRVKFVMSDAQMIAENYRSMVTLVGN